MSRGPSQLQLVLDHSTRSKVRLLEAAEQFLKALEEEKKADEAVTEQGATPTRLDLDPVTYADWQVHRGHAFWDRQPAEATPLRVAE